MVIAALFTIDEMRRQLKYPSEDEWIQRVWGIYTMEYNSVLRKEDIFFLLFLSFSVEKRLAFQSMNLGTGLPGLNPNCDTYKPYDIGEIT